MCVGTLVYLLQPASNKASTAVGHRQSIRIIGSVAVSATSAEGLLGFNFNSSPTDNFKVVRDYDGVSLEEVGEQRIAPIHQICGSLCVLILVLGLCTVCQRRPHAHISVLLADFHLLHIST